MYLTYTLSVNKKYLTDTLSVNKKYLTDSRASHSGPNFRQKSELRLFGQKWSEFGIFSASKRVNFNRIPYIFLYNGNKRNVMNMIMIDISLSSSSYV